MRTMLPMASEQKLNQKPKSKPNEIELCFCHHSIRLEKKTNRVATECQNRIKNERGMPIRRSRSWPNLGQKLAIVPTFFKDIDFIFVSTFIYIKIDRQTK